MRFQVIYYSIVIIFVLSCSLEHNTTNSSIDIDTIVQVFDSQYSKTNSIKLDNNLLIDSYNTTIDLLDSLSYYKNLNRLNIHDNNISIFDSLNNLPDSLAKKLNIKVDKSSFIYSTHDNLFNGYSISILRDESYIYTLTNYFFDSSLVLIGEFEFSKSYADGMSYYISESVFDIENKGMTKIIKEQSCQFLNDSSELLNCVKDSVIENYIINGQGELKFIDKEKFTESFVDYL